MTAAEWADIAARITANWPRHPLPNGSLAKFYDDLRDLPAAQVVAALEVLHREGREFPPTAGQIIARLADLALDAPDWSHAARRIRRLVALPTNALRGGVEHDRRAEALEREHPLVQAFVADIGWREISACPEADRVSEAQLRGKWEAFTRRQHRELALAGIEPAGLPALERLERRPGLHRFTAPHQLNPSTRETR